MGKALRRRGTQTEEPWLKAALKKRAVPPRPWLPRTLRDAGYDAGTVSNLNYIVVEEIVNGRVGLSLCAWPDADPDGRLRFDLDTVLRVGVSLKDLSEMAARSAPREDEAEIHIGDSFAAEVVEPIEPDAPPETWMKEPLDITSEARKISKLAYYAATTTILSEDEAQRWSMMTLEA